MKRKITLPFWLSFILVLLSKTTRQAQKIVGFITNGGVTCAMASVIGTNEGFAPKMLAKYFMVASKGVLWYYERVQQYLFLNKNAVL